MALVYLSSQTASASSSLSFTSGIDSTYDAYEFYFVNMHPATISNFSFQVNAAGQTGFNEVITSSTYRAYHNEVDTSANLEYRTGSDQAQGTAYQVLAEQVPTDADQSVSGILRLYAPSNTTYVKHFTGVVFGNFYGAATGTLYPAGYINTTSAIDEIDFKFSSGNVDAGTIHMYGVS